MDYNLEELKENLSANCGRPYRQCAITVMDTIANPDITFDEEGICNYVYNYQAAVEKEVFNGEMGLKKLDEQVNKIKQVS